MFDNGDTEEFLFFVCNFNMTLEASGMLKAGAKVQYICTLVRGEKLRQFDNFSAEVEGAVQVKAYDAPRNEEAAQFKSETLCRSFD